jgi:Mlc titration factor MtfA (ptsG expression regulator)
MFEWWHQRLIDKVLQQPFADAHRAVLERNVKHYGWLDADSQQQLRDLVQVFIADKTWEGCGGLELTDEMKVTIAAQACLLVLALPHRLYKDVDSILVYPSTVLRPARQAGIFTRSSSAIASGPIALLGEAHARGPVVLAWDRVLRDGKQQRDGHNVVYHEFAHKLDMLDSHADGTPPLATHEEIARWQQICERVYLDLRVRAERGKSTFIDEYGATNEAEFFAVVTEHFFEQPRALRREEPELYDVLRAFYRQDPEAREPQG